MACGGRDAALRITCCVRTATVLPCVGTNDTCTLADQAYAVGGTPFEIQLYYFGTMGLRGRDGSTRPAYNVWKNYLDQSFTTPSNLNAVQVYPNPLRPSQGNTRIHFNRLPAGTRVRIYTLAGEKVNDLTADSVGHAAWNGTNQSGQLAASGVYFVLIQNGGDSKKVKVAIQR